MTVVAVLPKRHFAQEKITKLIDAIGIGERKRVDYIADRFRHLLPAIEQEAMREDPPRHVHARGKQERRPVDRMEAHDVLSDHVQVGRPVAAEFWAPDIRITDGRDVVRERIDPNIHDMLRVRWYLDPPVEGRARDGEILQTAPDEAGNLVEALLREHEIGMPGIKVEQLALIGGETKKIALLLDPFDRCSLRTNPVPVIVQPRFILIVIRLIPHRIPTGIFVQVNIAGRFHALPDTDRCAMVALLRRPNELVVRAVEALNHRLEARDIAFDQIPRRELFFRRSLQHLHAMLVRAGEKEHLIPVKPHEPSYGIGRDRLIGVADMRWAIGVGNGRRNVVARLVSHWSARGQSFQPSSG